MGEKSALKKKEYLKELERLTVELVKLQAWIRHEGLKLVVIFEGRDAAGKGGVIKAITGGLNPRYARIAALPAPTERERTQWYFQRYVAHLPSAGEMVFFDRSWYNRAGVERVMKFCTKAEYDEFRRTVPEFERMLIRSGIILVKYWFSVSDEVQEARFKDRLSDPAKRWKLSPMDMAARSKWVEYSKAKDDMFAFSDLPDSPWHVVDADDKYCARLNTIAHLLALVPYRDLTPEKIELPERQKAGKYRRPPMASNHMVPAVYPGRLLDGTPARNGVEPDPGPASGEDSVGDVQAGDPPASEAAEDGLIPAASVFAPAPAGEAPAPAGEAFPKAGGKGKKKSRKGKKNG
jgi:polyphosphate kinase 2